MRVDDGRHHRLAGNADAGGAGGHGDLAGRPDLRDAAAGDDDGCVLDRGAPVADDHAGTFERGGAGGGLGPAAGRCSERRDGRERGNEQEAGRWRQVHGDPPRDPAAYLAREMGSRRGMP